MDKRYTLRHARTVKKKQRNSGLVLSFLCFFITFGGQNNAKNYTEDLSGLRHKFPEIESKNEIAVQAQKLTTQATPEYHVTEILNQILENKRKFNATIGKVKCYTIQIYLGSNRLLAFSIFEKIHVLFQDASVHYSDTNYVVRLGKCLDKLELLDKYIQMLKIFPNITVRSIFVPKVEVFSNIENDAPMVDDNV